MNNRVKKIWLKALRSGKYKQGKGQLYNDEENTYCCLGLLCEEFLKTQEAKNCKFRKSGKEYGSNHNYHGGSLPIDVVEWAGLDSGDPIIYYDKENVSITASEANDFEKKTFYQIARYIEKNL